MSKLNNNETIVYYFDKTQGVNDLLSGLYTSLLPNSEVCALTFLCFLTSLVIFFKKNVIRAVVTFNNVVVSDYDPRCFGVLRHEPRSVGDRVGVSSTDSLALLVLLI